MIAVASRSFSRHAMLRARLEEKFPGSKFNDTNRSLKGTELVEFLKDAEGAIIALETIDGALLEKLPKLKWISKYGVGLDNIHADELKKHGVQLGWTGGVNARGVSELTLGFALALLRNSFSQAHSLRKGEWNNTGGRQLSGKTFGIIGCGFIGKDLTKLLKPFGCKVLVHDILDMGSFCKEYGATQIAKNILLRDADIVSVHVPYGDSTHYLIGSSELALMKPTAVLINTARGNIVDEGALLKALQDGKLLGAAADVFAAEPASLENKLLSLPNFIATPHVGGSTDEAVLAMGLAAIENLCALAKNAG